MKKFVFTVQQLIDSLQELPNKQANVLIPKPNGYDPTKGLFIEEMKEQKDEYGRIIIQEGEVTLRTFSSNTLTAGMLKQFLEHVPDDTEVQMKEKHGVISWFTDLSIVQEGDYYNKEHQVDPGVMIIGFTA
jgi:hypothetical protein